jgi:hypothetical protein
MRTRATAFRRLQVITLALLVGGCDQPAPTQAVGEGSAAMGVVTADHMHPGEALPLHVRGVATLIRQEFAPDFGPPLFGRSLFDGRCSVPSDYVIRFFLQGQATHLGRFTSTAEHCSEIDFQTGLSSIVDGILTLTAADGDELWDHYKGQVTPSDGATETHSFLGGSGRFAGASGGGTSHVVCDRDAGTCVFELEGVLRYDASDRSR